MGCDLWFRFYPPRPHGRGYESAALRALFGLVPVLFIYDLRAVILVSILPPPRPDGRGYESAALRALFGLVPVLFIYDLRAVILVSFLPPPA